MLLDTNPDDKSLESQFKAFGAPNVKEADLPKTFNKILKGATYYDIFPLLPRASDDIISPSDAKNLSKVLQSREYFGRQAAGHPASVGEVFHKSFKMLTKGGIRVKYIVVPLPKISLPKAGIMDKYAKHMVEKHKPTLIMSTVVGDSPGLTNSNAAFSEFASKSGTPFFVAAGNSGFKRGHTGLQKGQAAITSTSTSYESNYYPEGTKQVAEVDETKYINKKLGTSYGTPQFAASVAAAFYNANPKQRNSNEMKQLIYAGMATNMDKFTQFKFDPSIRKDQEDTLTTVYNTFYDFTLKSLDYVNRLEDRKTKKIESLQDKQVDANIIVGGGTEL